MDNLITLEQHRWESCKVNADRGPLFKRVADRLTAPDAVKRYKAVEAKTGVPWWFIAVVHEREASQRWDRSLAQGDPWDKASVHVPKNRGPFNSWEDAAYDALVKCPPYAARNKDWSPGGALAMLEQYNGLGYFRKGIPSPYIWAGTNQYTRGKFVTDHVFDPNAVDAQLGVAGLLKFMGVFKSSVSSPIATSVVVISGGVATATHSYWDIIMNHKVAFAIGLMATGFMIDLAYHLYKNRKTQ